jgi:DnaJ-class molecular chaperone
VTPDKSASAQLVACEKCGGTGVVASPDDALAMIGIVIVCKACDGVGKVAKAA